MTMTPAEQKERDERPGRPGVIRLDREYKKMFLAAFQRFYQSYTRQERLLMPRITHGYFIAQAIAALMEKMDQRGNERRGSEELK